MAYVQYVLYGLWVLACIGSAYFSVTGRRSKDQLDRAIYGATTNIMMGCMLIILAFIFMLIFSGSTVSIVIEALFLVLGAFNIFAGLRNRGYYKKIKASSQS